MFQEIIAKSYKGNEKAVTIWEHTNELLKRFNQLKVIYPNIFTETEWNLLYNACYYHDVGKANTKFQNKIRQKSEQISDDYPYLPEVPHGYLSCAYIPVDEFLDIYGDSLMKILMSAVYYHHDREPEQIEVSEIVIENDLPQYIPLLEKQGFNVREETIMDYGEFVTKENLEEKDFYLFIKIKGLLNKLDFAASAYVEAEIQHEELIHKLDTFFEEKNYVLNDLQKYMKTHRNQNHIVVASTGLGKTEAALYWIGNAKGIFTLPLKVSINSIYDRLIDKIKCNSVGLLHSDTLSEYTQRAKDEEVNLALISQTRQLSYPLTVCTIDQIIDFVALYPGFEMKLAILSYSKLVIDEIQMYSPYLVALIVLGLKHITNVGGHFLIMTATFPPFVAETMRKLGIPFEQRKEPFLKLDAEGKVISRHFMQILEKDLVAEEILAVDYKKKKVLVIVNTVTKAQKLYEQLKKYKIEAEVLHSRFIHADRKKKEIAIEEMGKLTNDKTGIWITTQVVEASIDIDFDVLFTELSDASGLFQRMGRVYRNRTYNLDIPNIYVYSGEPLPSGISSTSNKSVVDFTIYKKSKEALMKFNNNYISENDKVDIVNNVYTRENLAESNYLKEFDNTIASYSNLMAYELDSKPALRDIQNENIIPETIFRQNESHIKKLEEILNNKSDWMEKVKALTELKKYVVAIPSWAFQKAKKNHLIGTFIHAGRNQSYAIVPFSYSGEVGLTYDIDEDCMFM